VTTKNIRVVIVDDSLVAREMLSQILSSDPEIEVVGTAGDGQAGVDMVAKLRPDLVTMDIHMPRMDGLDAVESIMAYTPTPVLVVSSSVHGEGLGGAFEALAAGALEVMKKPEPKDWEDLERIGREIIRKVKLLSRVKVITHIRGRKRAGSSGVPVAPPATPPSSEAVISLVAIGSSTGGPSALMTLLSALPKGFPVPVLIAQHIADGFIPGLVEWLDGGCTIKVLSAGDGQSIDAGTAYLAPTGSNLEFDGHRTHFTAPKPGQLYIPSADTLFGSVAKAIRGQAVGVILTGMGDDGARGLKAMHDAGAKTIGQDEATSTVYGMPRAAAELGAVDRALPIDRIGAAVVEYVAGA
jgi:two-component system, chemotaxis family, protein-glutamate methylesterase/glutaminase